MRKTFIAAAVALGSAAFVPSAQAYSFEATYNLTINTCDANGGNDACLNFYKPGTVQALTLKVGEYTPTGTSFSAPLENYYGQLGPAGNGLFTGSTTANSGFIFEASQTYYNFGFTYSGTPSQNLTPSALLSNITSGSFDYTNSHNIFFINYSGTMQLTQWRDTSVMAAVPEPETYAMLLAGLCMMGFVAKRRSKR